MQPVVAPAQSLAYVPPPVIWNVVGTQVPPASRSSMRVAVMPAPPAASGMQLLTPVAMRKDKVPVGSTSNATGSTVVLIIGMTTTRARITGPSRVPPEPVSDRSRSYSPGSSARDVPMALVQLKESTTPLNSPTFTISTVTEVAAICAQVTGAP